MSAHVQIARRVVAERLAAEVSEALRVEVDGRWVLRLVADYAAGIEREMRHERQRADLAEVRRRVAEHVTEVR